MAITYNGYTCNGCIGIGGSGGILADAYGYHIPVMGVTMVVLPGDTGTTYVPAGSFDYYNNDASIIGIPTVDTQYDNYLRSKNAGGEHFTDDFMGDGIQTKGYGSGPNTNYVFTGNPDTVGWSECACDNTPGDRRYVLASNDFTLAAGSSTDLVIALITTNLDSPNGCPDVSFDSIEIYADTAWADYYNPPQVNAVPNLSLHNTLAIYPNPTHGYLYITNPTHPFTITSINIYNTLGQQFPIKTSSTNNQITIDVSQFPPGMYYLQYINGPQQQNTKFIKE